MSANALVQARVDEAVKKEAANVLARMGLTVSDAVRLLLTKVAREHTLPFDVRTPNAKTKAAMQELEVGKGKRFKNVKDLMADLNADD
jgi:DNA-damage-inducible protein J